MWRSLSATEYVDPWLTTTISDRSVLFIWQVGERAKEIMPIGVAK